MRPPRRGRELRLGAGLRHRLPLRFALSFSVWLFVWWFFPLSFWLEFHLPVVSSRPGAAEAPGSPKAAAPRRGGGLAPAAARYRLREPRGDAGSRLARDPPSPPSAPQGGGSGGARRLRPPQSHLSVWSLSSPAAAFSSCGASLASAAPPLFCPPSAGLAFGSSLGGSSLPAAFSPSCPSASLGRLGES